MYPNIILTNRLQPTAIVNENFCSGCVFNTEENNCKRYLSWQWKVDYFCINKSEYELEKRVVCDKEYEKDEVKVAFNQLPIDEQEKQIKMQVKEYCKRTYKKVIKSKVMDRNDVLCMREHPFYVNTVRNFRDRRYEYKELVKVWKGKLNEANKAKDNSKMEEAENRANLFESLQLAHKIILNSFYGYVMRKGARWYSMEMAAMVTQIGANIITDSRQLVEEIGIPLELDTDGIWCLLPYGFPETFKLTFNNGKTSNVIYPGSMLNMHIHYKFRNPQYQTLEDPKSLVYKTHTEMSVFFEVDGPYKAMILPASIEENKTLKKRYAIYNLMGKMTEIKGFEMKRRGELKLIQIFQSEIFTKFLKGTNLRECYEECATVAEHWYNIIDSKGEMLNDEDIIEYISESKMLSKNLSEYGKQKSCSATSARRLLEFLGNDTTKGKGLNTKYIISHSPKQKQITERAIPILIFSADPSAQQKYLMKWTESSMNDDLSMKAIIDWNYYKDRITKAIQKIILIPAAMQNIPGLLPQITLPDWLNKKIKEQSYTQLSLKSFLTAPKDIEESAPIFRDKQVEIAKEEAQAIELEIADCLNNCPKPSDNYSSWLSYQKRLWVAQRKQRLHTSFKNPKKVGLYSYFNFNEETLRQSIWHIVQITDSQTPGYLKVWFIAESIDRSKLKTFSMFNLTLHVQRKLYINSKKENISYKACKKQLPRNKKAYHLYEENIEEDDYQKTQIASQMYSYLCDPSIEGIYETKVPLIFRALLQLNAKVRPKKANYTLDNSQISTIFEIQDLDPCVSEESQYIPDGCFDYIYCSHLAIHDINFWASVIFSLKQINIFISCEKGKIADADSIPALLKQTILSDAKSFDINAWTFTVEQHPSFEKAIASVNYSLIQVKQKLKDLRKNAIVIIQSAVTTQELINLGLIAIQNEFPFFKIPIFLQSKELVPVNWANDSAKILAQRLTEFPDIVNDRISLSRRANLPVCNISLDAPLYLIDFLYAKRLSHLDYVLWYSEDGKPDIGGTQDSYNKRHLDEEIENPEIINSGFYRAYCIELKISHLAVNAILKSELLKAYDTEVTQTSDTAERNEFILCRDEFAELKRMMSYWMQQIKKGELYADMLLQHVYRWITYEQSSMYDPFLHRVVHKIAMTFFYLLIKKLTDMGARIVQSNFQSIIICTNKFTFNEAKGYTKFIIKTLKENEFFSSMYIEEVKYWKTLLYKDTYNYGGIIEDPENHENQIVSKWNLATFLPPSIENMVLDNVAEFISATYSKIMQRTSQHNTLVFEEETKKEVEDMTDVMRDLSMIIFGNIDKINKRRYESHDEREGEYNADVWSFPIKINALSELNNHPLEYVKFICHILSLDNDLKDTITVLKRNLLNIIEIGEFSTEAKFVQPSLCFVMSNVICDYCFSINDIDICREETVGSLWRCAVCYHTLNKQMIENRLIEIVKRRILAYHIQDLKCDNCKLVSNMLLKSRCDCAGALSLTCPLDCEYDGTNMIKSTTPFLLLVEYLNALAEESKMDHLHCIIKQIIE